MKITRAQTGWATMVLAGVVVLFSFQNCGSAGSSSGSSGAQNNSASGAGGSGSLTGLSNTINTQLQQYSGVINSIVSQYSSYLQTFGISQATIDALDGTDLLNNTLTSSQIVSAQAQADTTIDSFAVTSAIALMPSSKKAQILSALAQAKTQLNAVASSAPSGTASALVTADLEIINRLTLKLQ